MSVSFTLYTDGGARGNPGPGAIGAVLKDENGETVYEASKYIGPSTNNEAEYKAIIHGLEIAKEKEPAELKCYLDSELVVKQLNGEYKVKNEKLKVLFDQVKKLQFEITGVSFNHILRKKNKEADKLVNTALDSHERQHGT